MGVRFTAEVRRQILAATVLAEARGQARPRIRDLADALTSDGVALPPFAMAALNDDLEDLLARSGHAAGTDEVSTAIILRTLAGFRSTTASATASAANASVRARAEPPAPQRVGIGYDSHRFAPGGPMVLGGIRIAGDVHCAGHSDGDAVCHALTDAVLGAAGAGDIGQMFPDTDPANAGRDSVEMLRLAVAHVAAHGLVVTNADVTVIAERPKIGPHRDAMRAALGGALRVPETMVSIKGKTNEGMGWIGRGEGLAVIAVVNLASAAA